MQLQNHKTDYEKIPETWNIVRIDSFLNINMGQSPPSQSYNDHHVGLPFFQGVSDFDEIYPKPRIWCSDPKKIANVGQILLSVRAPVGEVNLTNFKCCVGRGIAALEPKNSDLRYCFYILKQFKNKFLAYSQGTTFEAINRGDIATVKVPFTKEVSEQQKIASILTKVDELMQKTDQVIEQTQRLKKGLIQELLTKGIGHGEFKTISLGNRFLQMQIPKDWAIEQLSKVAKVIDVRHYTPKYIEKGFPLILPNNVKSEGLDLNNTKFTNEEDYLHMTGGDRNPVLGDIIYSRNASFGIACRVEVTQKFSLGQDLVLIKPEKINPYLLFLIMNFKVILSQLVRLTTGSTFKRINLSLIKGFLIPYPSKNTEADQIAEIIQDVETQVRNYRTYFNLLQNLLTGKIRVKV